MLRYCDGFDLSDPFEIRIKYNGYSASFDQDATFAGRDGSGSAFEIVNTAFGFAEYMQFFSSPAGAWGVHFDIQLTGSRGTDSEIFAFRASSSGITPTQLLVKLHADGKLSLVDGRTGGILATSSATLSLNAWHTIEIVASFGAGNTAAVRLDGSPVVSGSGYGDGSLPDQVGFRYAHFGPPGLVVDNLVMYDGVDDGSPFVAPNYVGRLRITSHVPVADAVTRWAPAGGAQAWAVLNDAIGRLGGSPDGDLTYITPGGSAATQFETMATTTCFGKVYGVALNACLRPAGAFYPLSLIVQPHNLPGTLGSITPTTAAYRTYQALSAFEPVSGADWTDAVINGAYWGVQTSPAALSRVTALYLEKITSLVPQPFDCGGGSYSF